MSPIDAGCFGETHRCETRKLFLRSRDGFDSSSGRASNMKRALFVCSMILLAAVPALAGPNAGGVLIAHDADLLMSETDGIVSICDQGVVPPTCVAADVEIDGSTGSDPSIFKIYAAFIPESSPRLMGLTWGIQYEEDRIVVANWGSCGNFELPDTGWPASGTGSSQTWNAVQTSILTTIYWFAAYAYGGPGLFEPGPNPTQGGYFGDDSVPAILDFIAGYGSMGFDVPGNLVCPNPGPPLGACCEPTGECTILPEPECICPSAWMPGIDTCDPNPCPPCCWFFVCCTPEGQCFLAAECQCLQPNTFHPEWQSCDPNPCEPPPTPAPGTSWGQIKQTYR